MSSCAVTSSGSRDFQEYLADTENLACAMFDYSTLVCFGEMRHGAQYCSMCNPCVPYARERDESYRSAIRFTPDSILDSAYSLFTEGKWESGYGGAAWALIAEVALNRLRQKEGWSIDEVFIDRCVTYPQRIYINSIKRNGDLSGLWARRH